jgi:hypothetical protein
MATRYKALVKLMMELEVSKVAATSGTADSTAVDDTGDRNAQNARMKTMMFFFRGVYFWYTSSPASAKMSIGGMSCPVLWLRILSRSLH